MNVGSTGSMEQMQYRQMNGSGGGQGKGGMKDMMQSLSVEQQDELKSKMSSLSMEDRMSMVSQMKEVDQTQMSSDEYAQSLLDILDSEKSTDDEEESFSIYA